MKTLKSSRNTSLRKIANAVLVSFTLALGAIASGAFADSNISESNTSGQTPNNRIISAGSSITELLFALEAEQQLVAIDVTSRNMDKEGIYPQVGYHRQLSAEGLLALNPTHLIGSGEMGPEHTLTLLNNAHVKVVTVPSGDTKDDLYQRIDAISALTGTQDKAAELKATLQDQFATLEQRQLDDKPNVMFAMLSKGRPATIAGRETTIDTIISYAGAQNPAHTHMTSYKPLSTEAIVEMQPDYLLVAERAWESLGGAEGILKEFPLLAATPAGMNKRIVPISSSAIIGGLGLESIALSESLYQQFHP